MIELCKNLDMFIVNSRVGSDKHIGGVTCKNSSTVDYVLATLDFDIVDFCNLYSDVHNPVSLSFANCKNVPNQACGYINKSQPGVKLWSPDKADVFCSNIDSSVVRALDIKLDELSISEDISQASVANGTNRIVFKKAARQTFGFIYQKNSPISNESNKKKQYIKVLKESQE